MIRNKFIYAGIGVIFGFLFAIVGFWRTLLIIVLGLVGFFLGWYFERK